MRPAVLGGAGSATGFSPRASEAPWFSRVGDSGVEGWYPESTQRSAPWMLTGYGKVPERLSKACMTFGPLQANPSVVGNELGS